MKGWFYVRVEYTRTKESLVECIARESIFFVRRGKTCENVNEINAFSLGFVKRNTFFAAFSRLCIIYVWQ